MNELKELIKVGYPRKIKGNGGYTAYLVGVQPLNNRELMGIYRYQGGDCCHSLEEIKSYFEILKQ